MALHTASTPTKMHSELSRTNSLPSGVNIVGSNPVQFRQLTTPRSHKKAAAQWRTSVAITNSDYYNQRRPQISPLVKVHNSGAIRPAPSLDTISEYEMKDICDSSDSRYQLFYGDDKDDDIVADPGMFRYTPTPILDPVRQTVPTPLSRPTTPQLGSGPAVLTHYQSRTESPALNQQPAAASLSSALLASNSQAIHATAAATNQFLPLYINPESGNVYMFERGFYVPLSSRGVEELEKTTTANGLTKPPAPDRRVTPPPPTPPDHLRFILVLITLSLLCLNIPVFLLVLLPSLCCSLKARKNARLGFSKKAWTCSGLSFYCGISAIILHFLIGLVILAALLVLHFGFDLLV